MRRIGNSEDPDAVRQDRPDIFYKHELYQKHMISSPISVRWTFSVVSHGHKIESLIRKLSETVEQAAQCELIVTRNLPDQSEDLTNLWPGPFTLIENTTPKGFGANHNAAFKGAAGRYLATIDPDLELESDPFPELAQGLDDPSCGIVSTRVIDENGNVADHARPVPTPLSLLRRYFLRQRRLYPSSFEQAQEADWVAGLFMAMRADTFKRLLGFDERYHMYCEDVDLSLRSWCIGLSVKVLPCAKVRHPARRKTLKHLRHFLWHCASLIRLWRSTAYLQFRLCERGRLNKNRGNTHD